MDRAFRAFFDHRSNYPKLKQQSSSGLFAYPQAYHGSVKPDTLGKRLYISKIGNVRAVFHRPLPHNALLKTCTVTREPCGEWYASLVYEEVVPMSGIEVPAVKNCTPPQTIQSPAGIDLGLLPW